MLAALLLPVCFAAGSLAIDFSNAVSMKTRLQNAADGAALATASQLAAKKGVLEAKAYSENFFNGLIANEIEKKQQLLSNASRDNNTDW